MRGALRIGCAFVAGLVVGIAVLLGGMQDPTHVASLLEIGATTGASVTGFALAAISTATLVIHVALGRADARDLFESPEPAAASRGAAFGAILIGTGVGVSGLLPTTALVALPAGASGTVMFVASLLVGLLAVRPGD